LRVDVALVACPSPESPDYSPSKAQSGLQTSK
jgi:hypothetical protein